VHHDGVTVGRDPDVELDRARARTDRQIEGLQRVLGLLDGGATMSGVAT
jgi:hypothetical protein